MLAFYVLGQHVTQRDAFTQASGYSAWIMYILVGRYSWIFFIVSYFAAAAWCANISRELEELGVGGFYYSPGGVFFAFFIPILNLSRAYCAIRDLYLTFSPETLYNREGFVNRPQAPVWLPIWWAVVAVTMAASYTLTRVLNSKSIDFPKYSDEYLYMLISAGLAIFIQSVCWIVMIWVIERRQQVYLQHIHLAKAQGKQLEELEEPYHSADSHWDGY